MKKFIFCFILFLIILVYLGASFPEKVSYFFHITILFLLAFWFWGQIFIIHKKTVFSLLFLVMKSINFNYEFSIFLFAVLLLFIKKLYIKEELLIVYLTIVVFFPTVKSLKNDEYLKKSIILVGVSLILFIDFFSLKIPKLTLSYLLDNRKTMNYFRLITLFSKTLLHSTFYIILISIFYEALNDYFFKDTDIKLNQVLKDFFNKLLDR